MKDLYWVILGWIDGAIIVAHIHPEGPIIGLESFSWIVIVAWKFANAPPLDPE